MSDLDPTQVTTSPPLPALPPPRRGPSPVIAITLIALALAGLATVGYFAWERGYLDGLTGPPAKESPVKVIAVEEGAPGEAGDADPLERLDDNVAGLRPYRGFADKLREFDAELDAVRIETMAPGKLAESTKQQLYDMQQFGRDLVPIYEDFEQRAQRDRQPKLQAYQEILRSAFLERMTRFVEKMGQAYAADKEINHPVFTMSDTFIAAIETYKVADPEPIRAKWLEAVHAREQAGLTEQYADEIERVQEHIEKMKTLHREVDELLQAAPEYRIRGGIIGATARNLLDVFDSLAARVEERVLEFEKFAATLPEEHGSERLKELIDEFTRLAQEDHFHAFRETYKIYEQDKQLEHPAYLRLKEHFQFVEQHWPKLKYQYQRQYEESEGRWAKTWAQ